MTIKHVAHTRKSDGAHQSLETHLLEVGEIASQLTGKIGLQDVGQLIGLLHDFGKYSAEFQTYIGSATGDIDQDDEEWVDASVLRGKIDHSTAGAQWIWSELSEVPLGGSALCAQILALCIASHHSGLIDCLRPEGGNGFIARMDKNCEKTHLEECKDKASENILDKAKALANKPLLQDMLEQLKKFVRSEQHGQEISDTIKHFYIGFWTRYLFSCLIDADRINSADFENPSNHQHRSANKINWQVAIDRAESFLSNLPIRNDIDAIRRDISDKCKVRASEKQGIYSLTVPTGGGKTYTSLRYALHHAKRHQLDRIIYVIPYTSIIEQNASEIRKVVERDGDIKPWVLEHHSNLEPEQQTWHSKLVSENWDAPIVLTTMVQFLETLFSGGTRGVRRMHQLANSVIIFDEIQTLPINCTHIFCNALNFLTTYTGTTAVLCTATQPLLNKLKMPEKGQVNLPKENELIGESDNVELLFKQLERVTISNKVKVEGWHQDEVAELAISELHRAGSCLVIVNTKAWAKKLYQLCSETLDASSLFHLSTSQCAVHRKKILNQVRDRLNNKEPVLCISTQLIEAGVDVDFGCVIRFLAGLDSIAQAAGRCNRNGNQDKGIVHVLNPAEETIDLLRDITEGRDKALRVLGEELDADMLSPRVMKKYFEYYFYSRADDMHYPVSTKQNLREDTLLNLLSDNPINIGRDGTPAGKLKLQQSFMTAGKAFKAIDAPTEAVIVPYGEGKEIITSLCGLTKEYDFKEYRQLLKKAQKYSVNLFPNVLRKLNDAGAVHEIQEGEGIYYLDHRYYSDDFGVTTDPINTLEFIGC